MNIPDCTLSTCYYSFQQDVTDSESLNILCRLPCYMVFYGDNITIPILKNLREQYNLTECSEFIEISFENLWSFQYREIIKSNREIYWPTANTENEQNSLDILSTKSLEKEIICCNKFSFMLKTLESNPFKTNKFAWIQYNLFHNFLNVKDNIELVTEILNNITDKLHLYITGVEDKKYVLLQNKAEYYKIKRNIVSGSLITCGKEIGEKIFNRLNTNFVETTLAGYGHGDEMYFLEILDEFSEYIVKGYGKHEHMITNFFPYLDINNTKSDNTINIIDKSYIYWSILRRYIDFGYYREAYECSEYLLRDMRLGENWELHMDLLQSRYLTLLQYKPQLAAEALTSLHLLRNNNSIVQDYWPGRKEMYRLQKNNLKLVDPQMYQQINDNQEIKSHHTQEIIADCKNQDIVIGLLACCSIDKYINEIKACKQTWCKDYLNQSINNNQETQTQNQESINNNIHIYFLTGDKSLQCKCECETDRHTLHLPRVGNNYESSRDKQWLGLKHMYVSHPDADFYYLAGTDTYCNVLNLQKYLKNFNSNEFLYIGGHGDTRIINGETVYFHGGGAGFIISNSLMKTIYPLIDSWSNNCILPKVWCDVSFAHLIYTLKNYQNIDIKTITSVDFRSCNFQGIHGVNACCNNIELDTISQKRLICCHYMNPDNMINFHNKLHGQKFYIKEKEFRAVYGTSDKYNDVTLFVFLFLVRNMEYLIITKGSNFNVMLNGDPVSGVPKTLTLYLDGEEIINIPEHLVKDNDFLYYF